MDAPYQRLAADLRALIDSGAWPPGHRIPSARTLAAERGLTRGVAERAIAVLRRERLLEGRAGGRLFVAYPPAVRTLFDPDAPWPHGRGEAERGTRQAGEDLATALQVPPRTRLHWERTELLDPDGRPAMLVTTWRRGARPLPHIAYRCEMCADTLGPDDARALGLVAGLPMMALRRIRYASGRRPVEVADMVLPADRWRIAL